MATAGTMEFKYFAFISYSRKDSRAAAFLHKKLEKFRIPIKRVPEEMRRGLRKFVRPVFRDKRDLEVGESSFTEDVKKALEGSRFIIVLCSPNSARSVWVDSEIRYFLSTHGNDLSKVVPVVLAGNPGSGELETECLSACLLSDETRPTVVKRNLPTMIPDEGEPEKAGWEAGVVGVLSYLLKVKRMDIKATIDAEKMRQMKIYAAIGVVGSAIFAALTFWALRAESVARQNWHLAEANKKLAIEQRDRAVEAEHLADANRLKAEANEKRAVAGEKEAKEKAFLAGKTVDFLRRMLQEAKPDEHGSKTVIDLLTEQQSKVDLLEPRELRYSVALMLGQIMLEQSLAVPASTMLKYAYDFCKENDKVGKSDLGGVANLLAIAYNEIPGRSEEALALLSEVESLRRQKGADDFSMAITYLNMAASYFVKKDYATSSKFCEKTLACTGGKPCRATLLALTQRASIAFELCEYGRAEELCSQAFKIAAEMNEEPSPDLVERFVMANYRNGKYEIAKRTGEEALAQLRQRGVVTTDVIMLENDLGLVADATGNMKEAVAHYEVAIRDGERIWPGGHGNLAGIINNLGLSYSRAGGTHMAISLLSRAIEMLERIEGKDSHSLYLPLVNLGAEYKKDGNRERALRALERAHGICVKKFGADSVQLANVYFHIADLKEIEGRNGEARIGYEEALRILRLHDQAESELAVSCLGSLASVCRKMGEAGRAKELIDEAVALARKTLPVGNEVRQVIMRSSEGIARASQASATNATVVAEGNWNAKKALAKKAIAAGRNDEAEALYLELLHYLESTTRTFSTEYAFVCHQLGVLAERRGDLRVALAYYSKSRDTGFLIRGNTDIEVAITCKNMAGVLRRLGDRTGEEVELLRALPAYEAASGDDHYWVTDIYTYLGRIKEKQNAWQEAVAWYKKALDFDIQNKGSNTVEVAIDHEDIGDVQNASGEHCAAAESYANAISIRQSLEGSAASQKLASLENDLGNALWRGGRYQDAIEHYRRSYDMNLHVLGLTNKTTVVVLANLGDCERAVNDYTNAIAHLTLAAEMKKAMPDFTERDYGHTMNDLAIAYSKSGDHEAALRVYIVALDCHIQALGREDVNVMTVYGNIASEYEEIGKWKGAIDAYRKALDIALLLIGKGDSRTRQYYKSLGDCLYKARKHDKCAAIRKAYLDVVRETETLGPEYAAKAHVLYADALLALYDYAGAASNRISAVEAYRKCGEEYEESVAVSLCQLGYALMHLGEFKGAVEAFSESRQIFESGNLSCTKGSEVDLGIHEKLELCRKLVSGQLRLVVKTTKVVEGDQADRLGVKAGDIWCALDEWKADDYPDGKGLWHSLVKLMARFQEKPRQLTVYRIDDGKWTTRTFQFDGSLGGFIYGYDVIPSEAFNVMKAAANNALR